jgi:hypothetical protein
VFLTELERDVTLSHFVVKSMGDNELVEMTIGVTEGTYLPFRIAEVL